MNTTLSIPLLFLFQLLWCKDPMRIVDLVSGDMLAILFTGVSGVCLSGASFWCITATSPTTYCVVGAVNKIIVILFAYQFLGDKVIEKGNNAYVVACGVFSGMLYGLSKLNTSKIKSKIKLNFRLVIGTVFVLYCCTTVSLYSQKPFMKKKKWA